MSFSISWTDVAEKADSIDYLKNCFFEEETDFGKENVLPDGENVSQSEKNVSFGKAVSSDGKAVSSGKGVSCDEENAFSGDKTVLSSWQNSLDSSQYSLISGDNYPVLRMMENHFAGKIDIIYIDPPYNTGKKSFVYNDALFIDEKSAPATEDRHSAWLSFMSRRLKCAKNLLSETGCIFIAIGQEELYQLKLLCDQIFGEENFINDFMWLHGKGKKDSFSRTMQQSNLCYAKNIKKLDKFVDFEETFWAKTNPDNDPRGSWFSGSISFSESRSNSSHPNFYEIVSPSGIKWKRQWLIPQSEMEELLAEDKIFFGYAPEFDNVPRRKIFNGEKTEIIPKNIIDVAESTKSAQNHVDELLGGKGCFDNPKPVKLIEHLISITNMKKDITVMDFFAGSGTTMEAVYNLNQADGGKRHCILVQKPEKIVSKESRFSNIFELCRERVKKVVDDEILILLLKENENVTYREW